MQKLLQVFISVLELKRLLIPTIHLQSTLFKTNKLAVLNDIRYNEVRNNEKTHRLTYKINLLIIFKNVTKVTLL